MRFHILVLAVFLASMFFVICKCQFKEYKSNAEELRQEFEKSKANLNRAINDYEESINRKEEALNQLIELVTETEIKQSKINNAPVFKITAYSLDFASCGKLPTSRGYGISRSGMDLRNKDWRTKVVACDPNIIPLGSRVLIIFDDANLSYLEGEYICVDTGSSVKGNHLDLYMGEFENEKAIEFGINYAKVIVLED
jgi:3D (Asp-Asp-Asp) domain-containing protein